MYNPYDIIKENKYIKKNSSETCLHRNCKQCHGTGRKDNGQPCIHCISCPCKLCNPVMF